MTGRHDRAAFPLVDLSTVLVGAVGRSCRFSALGSPGAGARIAEKDLRRSKR